MGAVRSELSAKSAAFARVFLIECSSSIAKHSPVSAVIDGHQARMMPDPSLFSCTRVRRSEKIHLGCSNGRAPALLDHERHSIPRGTRRTAP